jgi:hypothetical protein
MAPKRICGISFLIFSIMLRPPALQHQIVRPMHRIDRQILHRAEAAIKDKFNAVNKLFVKHMIAIPTLNQEDIELF